jgi:putative transposase
MPGQRRQQRTYDHRLRALVRETGDLTVATRRGVPRSTAAGWLRAERQDIVTLDIFDKTESQLQAEVLKLRRRVRVLGAVVRLLLQLLRRSGFRLEVKRIAPSPARTALLRAVEHARELLPLRAVLRLAGISSSRLSSWTAAEADCLAADPASCPRRPPNQLTADEVITIHQMVTSTEYRHVPTSRLAILAQRLSKVFASPTTWARLVRERGWRRPRQRVHPEKPKVGLRTTRPDAAWHIDTTVVRLLNGSKAYVHAVIDLTVRFTPAAKMGPVKSRLTGQFLNLSGLWPFRLAFEIGPLTETTSAAAFSPTGWRTASMSPTASRCWWRRPKGRLE